MLTSVPHLGKVFLRTAEMEDVGGNLEWLLTLPSCHTKVNKATALSQLRQKQTEQREDTLRDRGPALTISTLSLPICGL